MPVPNPEVEGCLRRCLEVEGYRLSPRRAHGETGVDIVAIKGSEAIYIEVIGYKSAGATRAKDFFEGFFRTVSRLDEGATRLALALAVNARVGLPARARQHRTAWLRIAEAFPELELWLVDPLGGQYERTTWKEWARPDETTEWG